MKTILNGKEYKKVCSTETTVIGKKVIQASERKRISYKSKPPRNEKINLNAYDLFDHEYQRIGF